MNAWRELMALCTAARVFEHRAADDSLRAALSQRAPRLPGLIDRGQRSVPADADFAPDTDIQVFFMDSEPTASEGAARMEKAST